MGQIGYVNKVLTQQERMSDMVQDGLINRIDGILGLEKELVDLEDQSVLRENLDHTRKNLRKHLLEVGNSGDIDSILAVERLILENERKHFGNSASMNSSHLAC